VHPAAAEGTRGERARLPADAAQVVPAWLPSSNRPAPLRPCLRIRLSTLARRVGSDDTCNQGSHSMPEGRILPSGSVVGLPFQPVDTEALSVKWALRAKGEADGRRNQPPASAAEPSATEALIIKEIEAERERCAQDAAAHLKAQNDALAQLETAMDIAALRHTADEARSTFEKIKSEWEGEILRLLRAAREAREEYESFRTRHGLARPARQPRHRGLGLALLAFFVTIESALNGLFFAEGAEAGLLGGTAVALSVSVVNVVLLGAVLGFFPARWANHRNIAIKSAGMLLVVLGIVAILIVNAFIAHYRDAYERLGDAVVLRDVWAQLVAAPADLVRLQSWLLFLLGLGFAGLGFAKGYRLDDPYPGYGLIDRRRDEAETTYRYNRQLRIDEATAARDRAIEAIAQGIERLRGAAAQRDQILTARASWVAKVEAHETHLQRAATVLLTIYRDANRAHRTEPAPAHFDRAFAFRDRILERPGFRTLREMRPPRHDAETLIAELDRRRNEVLAAYREVLAGAPGEA